MWARNGLKRCSFIGRLPHPSRSQHPSRRRPLTACAHQQRYSSSTRPNYPYASHLRLTTTLFQRSQPSLRYFSIRACSFPADPKEDSSRERHHQQPSWSPCHRSSARIKTFTNTNDFHWNKVGTVDARITIPRHFSTTKSDAGDDDEDTTSTPSTRASKGQQDAQPPATDKKKIVIPKTYHRRDRRIALKGSSSSETEFFSMVRRLQIARLAESRRKTAANVNRALWGNVLICAAKFGAWLSSGSSALLAEFIHSVVDCGNQALLLVGLRNSAMVADRKHPYGYGKNVFFWALVSALGTFFLGAGISMTNSINDLMDPSLTEITWEVWGVLCFSFVVDGYVLSKTVSETMRSKPEGITYLNHLGKIRDPATLAILLEDGAACLGVLMAFGGIAASHATGNPIFDGIAGVGISALLGMMGIALTRMNHRFLLGQAVDREITDDIEKLLLSRRSVDSIGSVQSQWTGPETFSYKAEVDFDGTYLAAKLLPIYQREFMQIKDSMEDELQVLLALYAEDVIRTVEREVRHVEAYIRKKYPGAEFIELEPMSRDADRLAIDDNLELELKRVESDALNRYLKSLRKEEAESAAKDKDSKGGSLRDPSA